MSVAKVYCVNGQPSSGASSLPQWISKRRLAAERTGGKSRKRSKAKVKERGLEESQLTLIQEFGFPEASMKVRTSPDGDFALATGTYKPQVRCYDLRELALKWERHTSSENVDFQVCSCPLALVLFSHPRRFYRATGQRAYTCRMIERCLFIRSPNYTTPLEYLGLVDHSHITSLLVIP